MIPSLVKSGYRCVAPDHIGFGRSDKVLNDEWYVTDRHIQRLRDFIEKLNLKKITPFVVDEVIFIEGQKVLKKQAVVARGKVL